MATEVAIATSVSSEGENGQHSRSDGNSGRRRHAEVNKNDVPHQRTNNKRRRLGNTSVPPSEEPSSHYAIVDRPLEIVPSMLSINREADASRRPKKVIVLLDQARLETVKTRKGDFELLNCDDHKDLCKKYKKDPKEYRPDICHQELLSLIDSPLNRAGYLQVYIRTHKGVLIHVHPSIRVPRTFKRFAGLMVQLLHKMKIKAAGSTATSSQTLLKVIKNPFSQHLPPGTRVLGMSCKGTLYSPMALARSPLVPDSPNNVNNAGTAGGVVLPVCLIVGAMASGSITVNDHPYIEKMISISNYPLSGAAAISRILGGIEHHWEIV